MNSSNCFNRLNKTRGGGRVNSDTAFYTSLKSLKASFQKYYGLVIHHSYEGTNQTENKYGTTRANMSTVINEGSEMHCKAVTTQVFTVLLVELGTSIAKSKSYLEAYPSIRQTSFTVTCNSPVMYSSLLSFLFFISTLQYHL